jgi:hypothetical protein
MTSRQKRRGWTPSTWAGLSPNGIGQQKPNHFYEMLKVAWDNRRHPIYAWRVLSKGACDGCALGVTGFHDWTIEGVHLCTTRLKLLAVNTADAMDHSLLRDAEVLSLLDGAALRRLGRGRPHGRLPHQPGRHQRGVLRRRQGGPGHGRRQRGLGRVRRVKLPTGTLQVHWPEGNVLLPSGPEHREPQSHVPDYTAIVSLERA